MNEYNIVYKPESFLKHEQRFNGLKQKYKADKQLLASMMAQLQNSSYMNLYDRHQGGTSSTSGLVKLYNKDVRTMRENEDMLNRYEMVLRRAELND